MGETYYKERRDCDGDVKLSYILLDGLLYAIEPSDLLNRKSYCMELQDLSKRSVDLMNELSTRGRHLIELQEEVQRKGLKYDMEDELFHAEGEMHERLYECFRAIQVAEELHSAACTACNFAAAEKLFSNDSGRIEAPIEKSFVLADEDMNRKSIELEAVKQLPDIIISRDCLSFRGLPALARRLEFDSRRCSYFSYTDVEPRETEANVAAGACNSDVSAEFIGADQNEGN
jgi:hypothetical protein